MWKKIKCLYAPDKTISSYTHAANPAAIKISNNGIHRVFFNMRDSEQKSHINYLDIDLDNDFHVVKYNQKPVVSPNDNGSFDDRGCSLGCIVSHNNETILYYLGWNLGKDVPFRNAIGIAKSLDNQSFVKPFIGPVIDRSIYDPFSISYPFILIEDGIWKMWYGSHKQWGKTTDDMIHAIKYAESMNGIHWKCSNHTCIDTDERDYAFSRPSVIKEEGIYKMWYSYRGGKYRIGYAESMDGLNWVRKDELVGITVSKNGWDSEMICYPFVFSYLEKRYMLYNGNGYGRTGIGVAQWID